MVNATSGTKDETERRFGFIRSETISLVIDLIVVFFIQVLLSSSLVLLGSTFNSMQLAIHMFVLGIPNVIALSLNNLNLRSKVKKSRNKNSTMRTNAKVRPSVVQEGSSVVNQSDV